LHQNPNLTSRTNISGASFQYATLHTAMLLQSGYDIQYKLVSDPFGVLFGPEPNLASRISNVKIEGCC
jgi:hypothetical protein